MFLLDGPVIIGFWCEKNFYKPVGETRCPHEGRDLIQQIKNLRRPKNRIEQTELSSSSR